MDIDSSDILGSPNTIVRDNQTGKWTSLSFGIKSAFILAILLVVYAVGIRAWGVLLIWREKSYKLSMRRRHGIPDDDHRPFNVAYAAVVKAQQDAETAKRKAKLEQAVLLGQEQRNALPDQVIRQRPGSMQTARPNGISNGFPGGFNHLSDDKFLSTSVNVNDFTRLRSIPANTLDFADRYNPNPALRATHSDIDTGSARAGPSRRSSRKNINISDDENRKYEYEDSENLGYSKRAKAEVDESINSVEGVDWQESQLPHRGAKRILRDEEDDEDFSDSIRTRDKRARKVSLEKTSTGMDVDDNEDEDYVAELRSISRGKKRDRAEAGSTFGGDDEDSAHEAELEEDSKARRQRRKRRTVTKRKSDAGSLSRGKKRDRDIEDGESEGDDGVTLKVSRKKRGKKLVPVHDEEEVRGGSDVSMNESLASSSKGRSRRIGEEWESNGVRYKIGLNGQRLRQALVKKARQKFNMPRDSQHPDREANLEVCVETWLTEEEYRDAKAQFILAWQDSPKPSAEPETPSIDNQKDTPAPPVSAGKNLLWKSTAATSSSYFLASTTPPPGSKDRDNYRQSIATNLGLRINPFQQPQATSGKRIASAARVASVYNGTHPSSPGSPGLADSTNGRTGFKTFSKWEKQDLEAKAMMKMREANRKKEAEKEQKLKEEREKAEKEKKEKEIEAAAKIVPTIPTITVTKPIEVKPAETEVKPPTLSFAPPAATSEPAKDTSSKPSTLFGQPAGVAATPFTLPPMSIPTPAKTDDKVPAKAPPPTQPSSATSAFSFNNTSSGFPKPGGSIFGNSSVERGKSQQPKPAPTFAFPSAPSSTSTVPAPASTAKPLFSFSPVSQAPQAPQTTGTEEKKTEATSSSFPTLGSQGNSTQPAPQPQQSAPLFSFSKPTPSEPVKSSSVFGGTPSPAASNSAAPTDATSSTGSSSLKFKFSAPTKPISSAPDSTSMTPSSSLSGALGGNNADKPASTTLSFGFKAPTAPAEAANTTGNGTTAPKFNFAAQPSGSASGTTNIFGGVKPAPPAVAPQSNDAPVKSAFAGFGGATQPLSAPTFGNSSQGTSATPFGSGTTSNIFGGGTSNIFGAKASEASKTTLSIFGSSPSSTTPAAAATTATKSAFSFGGQSSIAPQPAPTAADPKPSPFSFKFGDAPKSNTTSDAPQSTTPTTGHSIFGKAAGTPSPFGFGATTGSFGSFGTPPASTSQQQQ